MAREVTCDVCGEDMKANDGTLTMPGALKKPNEADGAEAITFKIVIENRPRWAEDVCPRCVVAAILCLRRKLKK